MHTTNVELDRKMELLDLNDDVLWTIIDFLRIEECFPIQGTNKLLYNIASNLIKRKNLIFRNKCLQIASNHVNSEYKTYDWMSLYIELNQILNYIIEYDLIISGKQFMNLQHNEKAQHIKIPKQEILGNMLDKIYSNDFVHLFRMLFTTIGPINPNNILSSIECLKLDNSTFTGSIPQYPLILFCSTLL